jgi:HNH endonuclease
MCIYCGTNKYRKIYENHFGPISKEPDGRSYEIHHKDGNHSNNDPSNLIAVTLQEHYNIHYSQGDWAACNLIGRKLNLSPALLRELNKKQNLERVLNGTHHLLSGEIQSKSGKDRAKKGTLGFQNKDNLKKANYIKDKVVKQRIQEGTWILQDPEFHRKVVKNQIANGTHCSQKKITCPHCNKTIDSANYKRSHGNNCKILTGKIKKISKHPKRQLKTCEKCKKTMDVSNFSRHNHGPKCARQ